MKMEIAQIQRSISMCKDFLEKTNTKGTEIEDYLTKYLLVHICGCYENEIKNIAMKRASQANDKEVEEFVKNSIKKLRSFRISDITGNILGNFSDKYKAHFNSLIKGTEMETRFSNLVENRHLFAHGKDINMTFDELVVSYNQSHEILDKIIESLTIQS